MIMRSLLTPALLAVSLLPSALFAQIPRPAPDFAIKLSGAPELHLSQFKGKVLLLEFILTTCPHCQQTSVLTEKLYREYKSKGLEVASAAVDKLANPNEFRQKYGLSFPVGVQSEEAAQVFLQHSPMFRFLFPQVVFIDRKGVIRAHYPGGDPFFQDQEPNMRKQIESLLAEGAAPAKPTAVSTKKK